MIGLLFGLLAAPMQTAERMRVEVVWGGQDCGASLDGERLSMADLEARGERWTREGRVASVVWAHDVPYRCIGGGIYVLQSSGISDIASDWAGTNRMTITVPPGRCRFVLNGRSIGLASAEGSGGVAENATGSAFPALPQGRISLRRSDAARASRG